MLNYLFAHLIVHYIMFPTMSDQDPISLEKKKGHEMSPKNVGQVPNKVESKGSVTPIKKKKKASVCC